MSRLLFWFNEGAEAFSGVGDDSQDEQQDVGLGLVIGGKAPAVPTIAAGGRRGRIHYRPAPVYITQRLSGHGDSSQSLQFSEGTGHRLVLRGGAGQSMQRRQGSEGHARLSFEALNEQELIELIMLDAA